MSNHKAIYRSFKETLQPDTAVVDSRTELDRLKFLTDYSLLINFYNQQNKVHGSWNPLLMKDPVFLLADIAKFNLDLAKSVFHKVSGNLDQLITASVDTRVLAPYFNQKIKSITDLFLRLESWSHFMTKYHHEYNLKKYLIDKLTNQHASYFFALVDLTYRIELDNVIPGVKKINAVISDQWDNEIWNKGSKPFWEVLNLDASFFTGQPDLEKGDLIQQIYRVLSELALQLFEFINNLMAHAGEEYKSMAATKGKYPDTALLRSFVKLQDIYKSSLNKLSQKHLNFYYAQVLRQSKQQARPDQTFITVGLKAKKGSFFLKEGTKFKAGIDANKRPIEFINTAGASINSATITDAYSIAPYEDPQSQMLSLYRTPLPKPEGLKKNKKGQILSWKLFGGIPIDPSVQQVMSFVIASPMLLLKEGSRELIIQMTFDETISESLFSKATYYLSASDSWLKLSQVTGDNTSPTFQTGYQLTFSADQSNQLTLKVNLESKAPAILPFPKNKEDIESPWPMFKMEFAYFDQIVTPPVLTEMTIQTDVSDVSSFELFNDFGLLSPKKPYPLFGPTPLVNNSFMIGSTELFSKPLQSLVFDFEWEGLPNNFQSYYLEYNVDKDLIVAGPTSEAQLQNQLDEPFNNSCFTGQFEILQNKQWVQLGNMGNQVIFNVSGTELASKSTFVLDTSTFHPISNTNVQGSGLAFNDQTENGFVRLRLTGPEYGFGSNLYVKVVSNIALKNAQVLMNKQAPSHPPANLPYVPRLKALTASYSALQNYRFDYTPNETPVACYTCDGQASNLVYQTGTNEETDILASTCTMDGKIIEKKLRLFSPLESKGILNLTVKNLSTPCELNLYFDLARKVGNIPEHGDIPFRLYSASGWNDLTILSDGTQGFTRTGIIKLSIPKIEEVDGDIIIGVPDDPELYAHAILVNPNGIQLSRSGSNYLNDVSAPEIKAESIKATKEPIPEITKIKQPFASFGGHGAEDPLKMNNRVATSIKTKNRSSNPLDNYYLIQQNFPEIYYSKTVYDQQTKVTALYVVKRYQSTRETSAFLPLVGISLEEKILGFLTKKASAFSKIKVVNFTPIYVTVAATVTLKKDKGLGQSKIEISDGLKLFLSPWIDAEQPQLEIDQGLTEVEVLNFIKSMDGVISISDIQIDQYTSESNDTPYISGAKTPPGVEYLLVSSFTHQINCRHSV